MAAAFDTELATLASTTNTTTRVFTVPLAGVAAGKTLMIGAMRNGGGSGITSIVDTGANTWTLESQVTRLGDFLDVFRCYVTTPLVSGNVVTIIYGFNHNRYSGKLLQFSDVDNATILSSGTDSQGTATASATTTSTPVVTADMAISTSRSWWAATTTFSGGGGTTLIVGTVGLSSASTSDTLTPGNGYTAAGTTVQSGGAPSVFYVAMESNTLFAFTPQIYRYV